MSAPRDLAVIESLLARRFFVETAYFGGLAAASSPSARAHMLAGAGCCGCAEPLAHAQRLLDGDAPADGYDGCRVSPSTELPYDGFEHLLAAVRLEPDLRAPDAVRDVLDAIADDLAYVSRREIHRPPDGRRAHPHGIACVGAALLLRRLTGTSRDLPRVAGPTVEAARQVLADELSG